MIRSSTRGSPGCRTTTRSSATRRRTRPPRPPRSSGGRAAATSRPTLPRTGRRRSTSPGAPSFRSGPRLLHQAHHVGGAGLPCRPEDDRGERDGHASRADRTLRLELRRAGPRPVLGDDPRLRPEPLLQERIAFPNCWNGTSLDSADHRRHMAYSAGGACPASHPVAVPTLVVVLFFPGDLAACAGCLGPLRPSCRLHERLGPGDPREPRRGAQRRNRLGASCGRHAQRGEGVEEL